MLTTDRQNHVRTHRTATIGPERQQFTDAVGIKPMKRVFCIHTLLDVRRHEPPRIISRQTIGHLREIICTKAQKLGMGSNFASAQRGSWCFHHDTQRIGKALTPFHTHSSSSRVDAGLHQLHFPASRHKRNHDFGRSINAAVNRGLKYSTRLHIVNLGHCDTKPHTAQAQHWIVFGQLRHPFRHPRQR